MVEAQPQPTGGGLELVRVRRAVGHDEEPAERLRALVQRALGDDQPARQLLARDSLHLPRRAGAGRRHELRRWPQALPAVHPARL